MLWAKVVIPLAMAVAGTGAAAVAYTSEGDAVQGPSQVWIDGPEPDATIAPGDITVSAHATASAKITAMELLVDGEEVATDRDLDTVGNLSFATFDWAGAAEGEHRLVVRQVGGTGGQSATRFITVAAGAPVRTEEPADPVPGSPTTTPSASTTSSTSTSSTTTSTVVGESPASTTTSAPTPGTVPTTVPGTTPTTSPLPEPVAIDSATLSSSYQNRLYVAACGYTVEVAARIRNAEYADAVVGTTGVSVTMTSSGSTWRATLTSGNLFDAADVGSHQVRVIAGRGDDVTDRVAGTVTVVSTCPKD